ncbi:unnamed protein product [Penicillium egyptiacum]|uniref:Zn(2)-C6 fungal-type domain-containing protein n=1 Tax=Penicillium egyptiacum TaxID=1303716 RepID=A0A9W4KFP7_9EURO|nr:unnamed protein product [Penicillium egyptiacum]
MTEAKPRRTRSLGGCKTCKRRHVRCDQNRPICQTCSGLGLACEGFSYEMLWMPAKKGQTSRRPSNEKRGYLTSLGIRRHLYSEQYRRSMGTVISKGLVSGSIEASLEEIDQRSQEPSFMYKNETRVGPFAVLHFKKTSSSAGGHTGLALERPMNSIPTPDSNHGIGESDLSSYPVDIPGYADDLLQWSDLFGEDCYGMFSDPSCDPGNHFDFSQYNDTNPGTALPLEDASLQSLHFPQTLPPIDILSHASFLLKNFQKNIVPQMTVVPLAKSPWNILNVPAALVTLGELMIMESESVSHARQANLYSLLACSAVHLAMDSPTATIGSFPRNHWKEVSEQAYQDAKTHLKISLSEETAGARKAKLKDQLMAIYGLTEFAIFSGQYMDARRYLVDAERLLRFRALSKHRISQKLRLLINVYVWLRLIGESTYVLHSYTPTDSFIDNLNMHCEVQTPNSGDKFTAEIAERGRRIDDFLHLENSEGDLNIDEPKDHRMDVPDIHLHDSRKSTGSLCQQVYGMPETMLSLVSQTTRLANVMETLRNAQSLDIPISSHVWKALRRRSTRLENVINCFRNRDLSLDICKEQTSPYELMVQALNSSLVIFFYRRVRQVHPGILSGHVDHVIAALRIWLSFVKEGYPVGLGTLWPMFISGCEATTQAQRSAILDIVDQAGAKSRFEPFQTAKDIMSKQWKLQDEQQASNLGNRLSTWVDILREQKIWPMFC